MLLESFLKHQKSNYLFFNYLFFVFLNGFIQYIWITRIYTSYGLLESIHPTKVFRTFELKLNEDISFKLLLSKFIFV